MKKTLKPQQTAPVSRVTDTSQHQTEQTSVLCSRWTGSFWSSPGSVIPFAGDNAE